MIQKTTAPPPEESSSEDPSSPFEALLQQVRSALAARRLDGLRHVQQVEAALAAYRRAIEEALVMDFARDHQLRAPRPSGPEPRAAARRLRDAVLALPELALDADEPALRAPNVPLDPPPQRAIAPVAAVEPELPLLSARLAQRKLVVIGALAGRKRSEVLPAEFREHTEWVDTESGGVHVVGNLPQRIRQDRVAALLILDRAVQHRHTEPLVSAARASGVPVGFAGKGGGASLRRALESIEEQLDKRS